MDIQHLVVKLYARPLTGFDPQSLVPVFHRWIQQRSLEALLIDVADYTHVMNGPGIMLIAHEGHWAFDLGEGRPGVQYANKRSASGTPAQRLTSALHRALDAAALLESEASLQPRVSFDTSEWLVRADDRLELSPDAEGFARFQPHVRDAFEALYAGPVSIEHAPRRGAGLTLRVRATAAPIATLRDRSVARR
jgi:hypothetical protein